MFTILVAPSAALATRKQTEVLVHFVQERYLPLYEHAAAFLRPVMMIGEMRLVIRAMCSHPGTSCAVQDSAPERKGRKGIVRRALKFDASADTSRSPSLAVSKSRGRSVSKTPAGKGRGASASAGPQVSKSPAPRAAPSKSPGLRTSKPTGKTAVGRKSATKAEATAQASAPKGGQKSTTTVSRSTVQHRLETTSTPAIYDDPVDPNEARRTGRTSSCV
jgi:hypothetical protein